MNEETRLQGQPQPTPQKPAKPKKTPVVLILATLGVIAVAVVGYFGFFAKNPWFISKQTTAETTKSERVDDPTFNADNLESTNDNDANMLVMVDDYTELEDEEVDEYIEPELIDLDDPRVQYLGDSQLRTREPKETKSNTSKNSSTQVTELAIVDEGPTNYSQRATSSASNRDNEEVPMALVEQKPTFPGGDKAMYEWLSRNINYPAQAAEEGASGKVTVQFVIEKDGSITNVKVIRGKHPALDAEAVRVIMKMPKWNPGRNNGQPVRVTYMTPISFHLQ